MDNASCRRTESLLRRLEIVCKETLHLPPCPSPPLPLPKTSKSTPLFTSSRLPPSLYSLFLLCLQIHHPLHFLFHRLPILHIHHLAPSPHHRGPPPPSLLSQSKTSQIHSSLHLFPHSFAHSYLSPNPPSPPPFLSFFSTSAS